MPRNASGTYTLPNAAFSPSTVISSSAVNGDFSDIATALTLSLATTGVSSMTGPILAASGSVSAPGVSFASATKTGFWLAGTNQIGWTANSVQGATFNSDLSVTWAGAHTFGGNVTMNGATTAINSTFNIVGNTTWTSSVVKFGAGSTFDSSTVFVASGASHAIGTVPDPGASAGTSRWLREDATWVAPFGQTATTRQYLTTGSGATYTTPPGARTLIIKMIGGGGGGGGNGSGGGTGGDTIFNTVHAKGGSGGGNNVIDPGVGGSGGSGAATFRMQGSSGGLASESTVRGGCGGPGLFGMGSAPPNASVGSGLSPGANTGAGASGCTNATSCGGGGSGEYVELIITSPAATYTYTIGAGGTAGAAGGGNAGGVGGTGMIIVEEYY